MNKYSVRYNWKKLSNGTAGSRGFEVQASSQPEAERLAGIKAIDESLGCVITEIRVTQRQ